MPPKNKLKFVLGCLLRGAMCAVWMSSVFFGVMYLVIGASADDGQMQSDNYTKAFICLFILIVGASTHAHLIQLAAEDEN